MDAVVPFPSLLMPCVVLLSTLSSLTLPWYTASTLTPLDLHYAELDWKTLAHSEIDLRQFGDLWFPSAANDNGTGTAV